MRFSGGERKTEIRPFNRITTYTQIHVYNTALADSSRSLNLVQVDGDRWSPLPRAAKLGELVLARVALGQRAKVMASAACCFPALIVRAWPCLV